MIFMRNLVALLTGILFGVGLSLSEMINPVRVLAFLDLAGEWDATLLFVMLGAISVSGAAYLLIRNRERPKFSDSFGLPKRTQTDFRLVGGAAIFGIGWGIAGYCPGPAIAMLALQWQEPLVFMAAMLAGSQAYRLTNR